MSNVSDSLRKSFTEGDNIRDAGLVTPEDILRFDDILYGEDPVWQKLDVYRPRNMEGKKLPVIVSVHGGGWVYGDKERYQYYCMSLAQRGFAVVNFTYHLAPEYKFPMPMKDTNLVFSWVLAHVEEYGFNPQFVFGVGDSAGAQILGLYAALCTNSTYAGEFTFQPPTGFAPKAIGLNCGAYHVEMKHGTDDLITLLMEDYLPNQGDFKELRLLTLSEHITEDFPPTFIMTAVGDFLIDEPKYLLPTLINNKVPFVFRFYGDKDHMLGHVFHCNVKSIDAAKCNDEECDFFRRFLE